MSHRLLLALGLVLAAPSGPTGGGAASAQDVRVVVDTAYYQFEGRAPSEWEASRTAAALSAGLEPRVVATTRWQARWSPGPWILTPEGCAAGSPSVELIIHHTMPRLFAVNGASPDDVREWERYLEWLWGHEEGHRLRAYRAAVEMRDSLTSARAPTCAQLRPHLSSSVAAVKARYDMLQDAYDRRTRQSYLRRGNALYLPRTKLPIDTAFRDTVP
jgi:predicted secreted Zn-dependent protease